MLRELRHLIAVVESQSMSVAAISLGLTQPALSKSIRRLEEDLGLKLVERGPRGTRPTRAGWKAYARALKVESELRYLELDAEQLRDEAERRIYIGASPLWEIISVPEIVSSFHKRFPKVIVSLEVERKDTLIEQLVAGRLDFALCGIDVPTVDQDVGYEGCSRVHLCVAGRKTHPLMRGWTGAVEDIYRHNWIDYRFAVRGIRQELSPDILIDPGSVMETGSWLSGLLTASMSDYLVTLPSQLDRFAELFGLAFVPGAPPASTFEAGVWFRKSAISTRIGRAFFGLARDSMLRASAND